MTINGTSKPEVLWEAVTVTGLFILAKPLHKLLEQATATGRLSPILHRTAKLRLSLYADDAAIFRNPVKEDVADMAQILSDSMFVWLVADDRC
jgi:hypothetical protein